MPDAVPGAGIGCLVICADEYGLQHLLLYLRILRRGHRLGGRDRIAHPNDVASLSALREERAHRRSQIVGGSDGRRRVDCHEECRKAGVVVDWNGNVDEFAHIARKSARQPALGRKPIGDRLRNARGEHGRRDPNQTDETCDVGARRIRREIGTLVLEEDAVQGHLGRYRNL